MNNLKIFQKTKAILKTANAFVYISNNTIKKYNIYLNNFIWYFDHKKQGTYTICLYLLGLLYIIKPNNT